MTGGLSDANLFYGARIAATAESDASASPEPARTADLFYGARIQASAKSEAVPEEETEDTPPEEVGPDLMSDEDVFYGSPDSIVKKYEASLRDSLDVMGSRGLDEASRVAHLSETAQLFHDAHIDPVHAGTLHGLLVHHAAKPATPDMVSEWAEEANAAAYAKYGKDAPQRFEAARAFVAARPDLQKLLADTGLGSHPRLVSALLENAHRLKSPRGKR